MRPTLYQASRMLTTAGISAEIKFDPTQITNRLKKSVQRQITNGVITGGWSSHASRIAKYLCKQYKIHYTANTWYGISLPVVAVENRERFVELVQADLAAYLLDGDHYNPQWEKTNAQSTIDQIRSGMATDIRTHSKEYKDKLITLLMETRTPAEVEHAREVAALLDLREPITINQYNSQD